MKLTHEIDMSAGIYLNKKVGEFAKKGELLWLCILIKIKLILLLKKSKKAFLFQDEPVKKEETFSHDLIQ